MIKCTYLDQTGLGPITLHGKVTTGCRVTRKRPSVSRSLRSWIAGAP